MKPPSPMENAFASSSKVPLDNLRKVQPSATLPLLPPRAPDPKEAVYIPAGSVGNPLGIRPSSSPTTTMTSNQRPLPSGPRSLRTTSTVATPKKPVVVGANWSAARSSGSASNSTNNSVLVTPSSSTSFISPTLASTNSTIRPAAKVTDLSRILSYGSPSPPPPESEPPPPPPLQHQSGVGKWKRIASDDEMGFAPDSPNIVEPPKSSIKTCQVDAASSSASLSKLPPKQTISDNLNVAQGDASSTGFIVKSPATRPLLPSTSNPPDDTKRSEVIMESPSQKAKTTESVTLSTSQNSVPAKAQPEVVLAPKASTSKRT